ncbi:NAD(P)/FAD-dependent oxidoreductase [Pseudomonas aeruginosa]|uniref:NAD(P)/FAD-dependent oxidoreductase n=1 Tax=Pseudomonas aeruginosa TaxID=287 RepID=UPI0021B08D22|nr:FAD-binding oxidoreductase [Pseudomonas aeruginosa]HBO0069018.1 FAD-binding oxidoreductase [Pseudomonas aeruginosa]HCL3892793.1 FAD-binding oxidoreductase [Pseudomonas aeruginosa]
MYDPLQSLHPGHGAPHAPSYWVASAGNPTPDDGPLKGTAEEDVAIIGSGYTGLCAAYFLAHQHGIKAIVLEANQVAWGCSSRNGGFARVSGGHLWPSELISHYGLDVARRYFDDTREALAQLRRLITEGSIDCDPQLDGVIKLAHHPSRLAGLESEANLFNRHFNFPVEILSAKELHDYHRGGEVHGGIRLPEGFGLHPMKLAMGLLRMARNAGARVHSSSPVISLERKAGHYLLETPEGAMRARKVIIATNGYTAPGLHPFLRGRYMPVHSRILVTRPLTEHEIGLTLPSMDSMIDTRNLLYYYRRLPDNRLLFGGPGAVSGNDAEHPRHRDALLEGLTRKFPELAGIAVEYDWGGWVCMSQDGVPHIHELEQSPGVFAALGYSGSGISYATLAGRRLAAMAVSTPETPPTQVTSSPLPRFPFARFLRLGQYFAYHLYRYQDRRP